MNLLDRLLSPFTGKTAKPTADQAWAATFEAATLPPVALPKAPKGQQTELGHHKVVGGSTARLQAPDRGLLNTDRLGVRNAKDTQDALRQLGYSSPDVSASIYATLRSGIPETYTMVAYDMDGKINPAATEIAHELLRRLTYMGNVDGSFGVQQTLQSLSESLAKELLLYGSLAGEVVLDKTLVPASLNPVAVTTLKWYNEGKGVRPVQLIGGEEISLDIPTFIYVALDQDLLEAYSASPLEASLQPVLADLEFNNDVRKTLKRVVLPRLLATIDSEQVKKSCPPSILNDVNKFTKYKNDLLGAVQEMVNGAAPEDALISFSEIDFKILDGGKDPSAVIERMQTVLNAKLQTGVKTLPVVLGHGSGSTASSAESLLFLKSANILRVKLNEFYTRAFTIALRLTGQDCYVKFEYATLDLRPPSELEAYKAMEQSRVLELLSLGFISDEEACIRLTGNLPPAGFKPLSGTMFKSPNANTAGAAQPGTAASNTSSMGKALTAPTPKAPKS
jgi:hypothetical protein